jgi:hypothetical protein
VSESHKKLCTVDKVVLVELVRDNELSGPEELAGAAALFALFAAWFEAKSRARAEAFDSGAASALGAAGTVSSSSGNATNQPKSRSASGMMASP